ncbi:hypothetical protein [uncultured Microbulbifer sp.]|uniref:hypothetical protein n=1 Tax=uncultured Microbulbifer sp. TaxID=348147 RepID=UPI00260FEA27|nr:hypothetical protein [uncultured Microbulbifer sp.]
MVMSYMRLLLVIIGAAMGTNALACGCSEFPNLSEQYQSSKIVVLANLKPIGKASFEWEVTEVIKGSKPKLLENVEQGLTSCDPQLKGGQEWLLFLKENESPVLGWCSFNRNTQYLEQGWREDLADHH